MIDSNYLTATEVVQLIAEDKLTVVQIIRDHLKRYKARDDVVHAWAYLDEERALKEAERLDGIPKNKRGPLHGVILGVKDMMSA
jgi:Asp-tRNA(Asn)/Glu-tRNA(Gln) amidotransferase A subunit family amidase